MSTDDTRPAGRDDLSARDRSGDLDVDADAHRGAAAGDDLDRDQAELARDPLGKTDSTGATTEPPD